MTGAAEFSHLPIRAHFTLQVAPRWPRRPRWRAGRRSSRGDPRKLSTCGRIAVTVTGRGPISAFLLGDQDYGVTGPHAASAVPWLLPDCPTD